MIELAAGTTAAGVFTSSKCPGAPVDWCRAALKSGRARAVVVNAGNANVFTGKAGRDTCAATAAAAAQAGRLPGAAGVPGLDRRDRRGAAHRAPGRRPAGAACQPVRGRLGGAGARHHDHRHLPQGGDPDGADRRGDGADQRLRQGQRHDRARHGDDAVLRVHRRQAAGRCDADAAAPGRRGQLQLHDGR